MLCDYDEFRSRLEKPRDVATGMVVGRCEVLASRRSDAEPSLLGRSLDLRAGSARVAGMTMPGHPWVMADPSDHGAHQGGVDGAAAVHDKDASDVVFS